MNSQVVTFHCPQSRVLTKLQRNAENCGRIVQIPSGIGEKGVSEPFLLPPEAGLRKWLGPPRFSEFSLPFSPGGN